MFPSQVCNNCLTSIPSGAIVCPNCTRNLFSGNGGAVSISLADLVFWGILGYGAYWFWTKLG